MIAGARMRVGLVVGMAAFLLAAPALAGSFAYPNFSNPDGLQLNGKAKIVDSRIRLTKDSTTQKTGSAFTEKKAVRTGSSFSATFAFEITSNDSAADGIVFVLQPGEATAIGGPGFEMGYGGIKNSLGVGFKTFGDQSVSLFKNGKMTPIGGVDPALDLVGGVRYVWLNYDAETDEIEVYFSDIDSLPAEPIVEGTRDLSALGRKVRVGFTAATGGADATHEILDLYVTQEE